jgi:uracil-DNA glycosylase family 4
VRRPNLEITNYNDYKEYVFGCPDSECPKKCIEKKLNTGSIPGYFSYENVKALFVLPAPTPDDIKSGIAFTNKESKHVLDWIKAAGLHGNNKIGFTYLCKCQMSGFRNCSMAFKDCKEHLKNELQIANNPALVIVGFDTAKIVLPKALLPKGSDSEVSNAYMYQFVGENINLFGTQYFFLPSVDYIMTTRDEIRSQGEYLLTISAIKQMADILLI